MKPKRKRASNPQQPTLPGTMVANGDVYDRCERVRKWNPSPGETLLCSYVGMIEKRGQHGQYRLAVVEADDGDRLAISGSMLIETIESNGVERGARLCIIYGGMIETNTGRQMKNFETYKRKEPGVSAEPSHPLRSVI